MPAHVGRRAFRWKTLNRDEARRALAYAGVDASLHAPTYAVPDDGATHFDDCDLWLIVSDRLSVPLLPVKPYVMMVYDYLQRYENFLDPGSNAAFIAAQHGAERVFVTTDFTYADARDFAGLPLRKLRRLPMLVPQFEPAAQTPAGDGAPYFVWTTNLALHKNHQNAATALAIYYDELDGRWECKVTGVESDRILASELPHLKPVREIRAQSRRFRRNVEFLGELPDRAYRRLLAGARFLWHAGRVDNGTFSVVEAAHVGVPALSSDYPAMREIAAVNRLAIAWMDPRDPEQMASRLKAMETEADALRASVPDRTTLAANGIDRHAAAYWSEVRACL
jgi:glycosyltransferase involved in cell wall biosynthesis